MKTRLMVSVGAAALLLAAACGGGGSNGSSTTNTGPKVTTVNVGLSDFEITPSQTTIPSGRVTFHLSGKGPSVHEFVVIRSDITKGSDIPVKDGEAVEDGHGMKHIGEMEDVAKGDVRDLSLNLAAGRYILLCNEPGHFMDGMYSFITVT